MNLGYACINTQIGVCCNRTCRLATVIKKGEETGCKKGSKKYSAAIYDFLTEYGLNNLKAMYDIIEWSVQNGIHFYRISSGIFPHISNKRIQEHMTETDYMNYFSLSFAEDLIFDIGKYAQKHGIRLTMHPDHYNQLGTKTKEVLDNTFTDLMWHARLLDLLEMGAEAYLQYKVSPSKLYNGNENIMKHSVMCAHLGGKFGDKKSAIARWKKNFKKLPEWVQKRVCLENCEKGYNVEDLLPVCQELNIPLIFDFHHYNCWAHYHKDNPHQESISKLMPAILKTWERRGIIPKFHLSDQDLNKNIGAHHDYVQSIPDELISLMKQKYRIDIMIEAKMKEVATMKLMKKYSYLSR